MPATWILSAAVFGYAEAAVHWQRAIELAQAEPGAAGAAGFRMPGPYLRAMDALEWSGDSVRASVVAEEACRRFGGHPDPATAAAVAHRAAYYRTIAAPAAELPLIEEAWPLFEQAPPSAEHAQSVARLCRQTRRDLKAPRWSTGRYTG